MRKLISSALLIILCASFLTGCTRREATIAIDGALNIVVTSFPTYDLARAITGDSANLTMLVNPGTEIHSYDPTPQDIINIRNSDVFIYVGGHGDSWVKTILEPVDVSDKLIVCLTDILPYDLEEVFGHQHHMEDGGHAHDEDEMLDEHIWTSPMITMDLLGILADLLSEKDPENKDIYLTNSKEYIGEIAMIDEEIKDIVANAKRTKLIIGDRFPFYYFTKQYELTYYSAFPNCHTDADCSPAVIASLINTVINEKIPYIYYVELSNQNIARTLSEETGAELLMLHSCQNITKAEFEANETYVSLMKKNVENLRRGLN